MDCFGLSSSDLKTIDANEITSDITTIFSRLNVGSFSNLNELLVNNNATFIKYKQNIILILIDIQ
jgi:hypothetical protein